MEESQQRFAIKFIFLKRLPPLPRENPQEIMQRPWLYCIFSISSQELVYTLYGGRLNMYRSIEGRSPSPCVGDGFEPVPWSVSFCKSRAICSTLWWIKHPIKEIVNRELGSRKFSRLWVPHSLSDSQKLDRIRKARHMLDILLEQRKKSFNCIVISDQSWFVYLSPSDHMFASGREDVILREKQIIGSARSCWQFFSAE
jgi:hypothetical protein